MKNAICHCGVTESLDEIGGQTPKGWYRVATFDQKLIWLCPVCLEKVKYHANEIFKLTGSRYPSISRLIPGD